MKPQMGKIRLVNKARYLANNILNKDLLKHFDKDDCITINGVGTDNCGYASSHLIITPDEWQFFEDPYAELKAAHNAGKTIQRRTGLITWGDVTTPPSWLVPAKNYRVKPECKNVHEYVKLSKLCYDNLMNKARNHDSLLNENKELKAKLDKYCSKCNEGKSDCNQGGDRYVSVCRDTMLFKQVASVIGDEGAYKKLSMISAMGVNVCWDNELESAFNWGYTPQGRDYWDSIDSVIGGYAKDCNYKLIFPVCYEHRHTVLFEQVASVIGDKGAYKQLSIVLSEGIKIMWNDRLLRAFTWVDTPQGRDYWTSIHDKT